MTLQWFDGGDSILTAMGQEYNYTTECEFGRNRLWKVSQTWYREDLDTTILLKATWAQNAESAKAQAEAWEDAYDPRRCEIRSYNGRVRTAAKRTRELRRRIR